MRNNIARGLPLVCLLWAAGGYAQDEMAGVDPDDSVIRLDTADESRDPWSQLRDASDDANRDPGLIQIGRLRQPGVRSFFGLPVALTQEDLRAAEVDIAVIGAPIDMGVGMRGAGEGPSALRAAMRGANGGGRPHMHVGVAWKRELVAVDYGNAPIDLLSVERSMPPVRKLVREVAETGAIPVVIGGDHSLEYPNVAGVADVYGKGNVGVIHFDAHFDAGDPINGHLISHAQPIRRLVDDVHILGKNYIQVGLRGYWPGE
jgi:agmatinase